MVIEILYWLISLIFFLEGYNWFDKPMCLYFQPVIGSHSQNLWEAYISMFFQKRKSYNTFLLLQICAYVFSCCWVSLLLLYENKNCSKLSRRLWEKLILHIGILYSELVFIYFILLNSIINNSFEFLQLKTIKCLIMVIFGFNDVY